MTASRWASAWLLVRPSSFDGAAGLVFAGFVAATVAQVAWAWLRSRPRASALDVAAFAGLVVATTAAVGLAGATQVVARAEPARASPLARTVGAVALALTGLAARGADASPRHGGVRIGALADRCLPVGAAPG